MIGVRRSIEARAHRALRRVASLVASLVACLGAALGLASARSACGEIPGTLPLVAAGDEHAWWVVEAAPTATSGASAQSDAPYLLMHHALDEPAPTERLVMRFAQEPEAIAADGARLFIVARPEGGRRRLVTSMIVRQNPAVGHWFDSSPRVHEPLDPEGELRDLVAAGGKVYALLRRPSAQRTERERLALLVLAVEGEGTGQSWTAVELPDLDFRESSGMLRLGGTLAMLGRDASGALVLTRLAEQGAWTTERVEQETAGISMAGSRGELGAVEVAGRTVLVDRLPPLVDGGPASIRLSILRQSSRSPWSSFPEPDRPWALVGFGPDALLLGIGAERRGVVRQVAFASSVPGSPVDLGPPGFASRGWVHLPIIGVLSVALSLAAVLFGSEAYLDARRQPGPSPVRPRGASLGQRATAWVMDLVPGVAIAWACFGGNPLDLLQVPAFIADLESAVPAIVAVGLSWAIAAFGDVAFGRSVGKRLAGLEIISAQGGPSTMPRRFVRALASAICVASPIVLLLALLQPNRDGPAEMVSGTALVEAPVDRSASDAPGDAGRG